MTESATAPAYEFPSGIKSSFVYWAKNWSKSAATQAEEAIVKRGLGDDIPLVDPSEAAQGSSLRAVLHNVQLEGSAKDPRRYMRVLEIGRPTKSPDEHTVFLTHGYGNGLGFYFQQFRPLASLPNVRYYYLDWLGMGRSGRPTFPTIKHGAKTEEAAKKRVTEAEEWFTTSLDECRRNLGVEKINTLCGHSIGGYLSASYALRYPQNVGKLILISPVGLPEAPWNTFAFEDDDVEARATLQFEQNELAADALQEQMMPASDPKVEAPTSPTLSRSSSNSRVQSGASSSSDTDGAPTDHFKRKEPPSASSEP